MGLQLLKPEVQTDCNSGEDAWPLAELDAAWLGPTCSMQEIIVGMSGLDRIIFQTNINGDPQILMGILWDSQDLKQPNLSGCSYQGCVCVFICQLLLRLWGR